MTPSRGVEPTDGRKRIEVRLWRRRAFVHSMLFIAAMGGWARSRYYDDICFVQLYRRAFVDNCALTARSDAGELYLCWEREHPLPRNLVSPAAPREVLFGHSFSRPAGGFNPCVRITLPGVRQRVFNILGLGFSYMLMDLGDPVRNPAGGYRFQENDALFVPYWLMALVTGALAVRAWRRFVLLRRAEYRRRMGLCLFCGYDRRASPARCPECGTATDREPSAKTPQGAG